MMSVSRNPLNVVFIQLNLIGYWKIVSIEIIRNEIVNICMNLYKRIAQLWRINMYLLIFFLHSKNFNILFWILFKIVTVFLSFFYVF